MCIALFYKHSLHKLDYYINSYLFYKIVLLLLYLNFDNNSSNNSAFYAITKHSIAITLFW